MTFGLSPFLWRLRLQVCGVVQTPTIRVQILNKQHFSPGESRDFEQPAVVLLFWGVYARKVIESDC